MSNARAGYYGKGVLRQATLSYAYLTPTDKQSGDYISKYAHRLHAAQSYGYRERSLLDVHDPSRSSAASTTVTETNIDASGRRTGYDTYALLDARLSWERRHLRIYLDGNNITATAIATSAD